MTFSPLTRKKLRRFKSIKRGYYAFIIFSVLILASMFAEVLVNSRALVVRYQGGYYFPVYSAMIPGTVFGLDYPYETNYRELSLRFQAEGGVDRVLMPLIPFNPLENDLRKDEYPPFRLLLKTVIFWARIPPPEIWLPGWFMAFALQFSFP